MADKKMSDDTMDMSAGDIIQFLKENNINYFEYCEKGRKIAVKYQSAGKTIQKEKAVQQETKKLFDFYILKSAIVGYCCLQGRQEGSDKIEPLVRVGDKVGLEDILCMIECMKLPNEIKLKDYKDFSAENGIIEEILVENEQPVDYGMPLMKIKPCIES